MCGDTVPKSALNTISPSSSMTANDRPPWTSAAIRRRYSAALLSEYGDDAEFLGEHRRRRGQVPVEPFRAHAPETGMRRGRSRVVVEDEQRLDVPNGARALPRAGQHLPDALDRRGGADDRRADPALLGEAASERAPVVRAAADRDEVPAVHHGRGQPGRRVAGAESGGPESSGIERTGRTQPLGDDHVHDRIDGNQPGELARASVVERLDANVRPQHRAHDSTLAA